MDNQAERWDDVGRLVTAAVEAKRGDLSIANFAAKARITDKTLKRLMSGEPGDRRTAQLNRLGLALGWRDGWLYEILAGREPKARDPEDSDDPLAGVLRRLDAIEGVLRRLTTAVELIGGTGGATGSRQGRARGARSAADRAAR